LVAAQMLAKQGCRVKNLAGGMQFWAGRTTR
jgi:rhodanese-related sulfurtransferase